MIVAVRQAVETDLPAILGLYAQPEIDDGSVLSVEDAEQIYRSFAAYPDYRLFVAIDGARVVGSYALLIMDNIGHLGARSAIIEAVVVDPAVQGAGVGKAMMRHALAEARDKGCYKAALSTNARRERAHAFYESLGFRRHGYSFLVDLEDAA